jgi:hypothetical protein
MGGKCNNNDGRHQVDPSHGQYPKSCRAKKKSHPCFHDSAVICGGQSQSEQALAAPPPRSRDFLPNHTQQNCSAFTRRGKFLRSCLLLQQPT